MMCEDQEPYCVLHWIMPLREAVALRRQDEIMQWFIDRGLQVGTDEEGHPIALGKVTIQPNLEWQAIDCTQVLYDPPQ